MSALSFHQESIESWDANAEFWDNGVGEQGNKYWKALQLPTLKRMIQVKAGSKALDLATGNGLAARWLASEGASVLATDGSEKMLGRAKLRHSAVFGDSISYRQLDVTDIAAFEALERDPVVAGGFDIILINMAIMDIATLEPMAESLPRLLKKDGVFVATLLHPVFWTSGATRNIKITDDAATRESVVVRGKMIRKYLDVPPTRGVALYGSPAPQVKNPFPQLARIL
ncbi:hypothetical protein DL762_004987 [Monosporascus cannonballus]|uniref:Methyltransferase type 11 domain-containing protein n=1 Tax=Monosporascus cannonballus TaxID=155416 RepID=A0ABY0H980_9PEZI|nr:hypothetical protein DL762_004987 [Monosporascus cannonballus]